MGRPTVCSTKGEEGKAGVGALGCGLLCCMAFKSKGKRKALRAGVVAMSFVLLWREMPLPCYWFCTGFALPFLSHSAIKGHIPPVAATSVRQPLAKNGISYAIAGRMGLDVPAQDDAQDVSHSKVALFGVCDGMSLCRRRGRGLP